ncbi:MAG: AMP-binding protein, partial [Vicinamibacteria bacterium]
AHFLSWQRERFGVGPGDRIPKLTSLAFDAVLRELFLPLTSGATLCLPENEAASLDRLLTWMQSEEVTLLHTVPTFAGALLSERPREVELPSLRAVFFSGEPLTSALVNRWREAFGARAELVNFYGPTETTMIKCFHVVPEEAPNGVQPLGSPLPATQALVLGRKLGRRGVGEVGEIALRTPFRTRGYLNRPEETSRAFVPNPHSGESDDLLYLTGDLGRHRSDGSIEILGRRDAQVKIRGARVELSEIEAACARDRASSMAECAAVMSDSGEEPRLSLYLVPRAGKTVDVDELKKSLSETLPEYMVPSAFVVLDALPRTPSGKLDRKELPEPDWSIARSRYRAPRTPTEEELLSLWAELLSIANPERVSVDEDFFDLGGHSLLATRLVSRIRRQFRIEIPVRRVFETPTISGLSRAVDELLRSGEPSSLPPAIEPAPEGERDRLSFSQRRMWFFDQMVPGSPAYNIPLALRIRGPLSEEGLSRALRAVVSRHEALRTTFEVADGEPRVRLGSGGDTTLEVEGVTEDLLRAAVRDEIHRPFDLSRGPLLRAKLLRLSDLDRVLVVTMHHIVSDAWSIALFLEELSEHYRAAVEGRDAAVADLPVQYADFARWQHRWLSAEALRDDLEYWKRKLFPPLPVLDLPTDRPRPKVQSFAGARLPFRLSEEATSGLKRLARAEGATLYSLLLAAFGVLLHRHTGDEDVLIGSPVASRHREELERLIGLFINSVVLRIDLSGDPSFRELLEQVRRTTLEAYAHQDLPFERLVEELEPDRDLGRNPLFQVMLVMHTTPRAKPSLEGAAIEPMPLVPERSRFDLTLSLLEAEGEIGGVIEYSSDLFEPSTIERMLGHYARLLEGIAESPGARIAALPLLGEEEREQVLSTWNQTTVDHDLERTVLDLFEEQVARNPEALAAAAEGVSVTYGELDRRASRLAGSLARLGVGLESPVAVSVNRSPDLLVAILAVMKTGGAYVATDPDSPAERIRFMLRDSRARAWITVPRIAEAVDSGSLPVMSVEGMAPANDGTGGRGTLIDRRPTPENLAYVIYTSGSTGAPKGVAVPHRGLSNLAAWHRRAYEITSRDRATQIAGPGFDASVWEVWPYLTAGASVHFADEETRMSPTAVVEWIARERITVSFVPTPLAEAALSEGMPEKLALRALLTGGDKLHRRPRAGLSFSLVNHYGPTETTVVATATEVAPAAGSSETESSPPIGRPIDNFQVYVLDSAFAPVAIGVEGELLIGGAGVARGYLGRP